MPIVVVDGKQIEVEEGLTVLQACELAGAEIPRFCYHERLAIAGNCRMCLVKVDKIPKPVASCAQPVNDGMVITTCGPEVKKMREGVMEFLLINHPLDCPICDQAGECDLQDQALFFGKGKSRYKEEKRAVEEKNFGPLIKTAMTRCIHCTRCVRFMEDVAGTNELGAVNRGEDMEIVAALESGISSELSGNVIDLCPVGALTSAPYAFKARPWELLHTETIDVMDAVGSNIRVDSRGREVMRVLPRINEEVNEEWISDKTRFSCDGLMYQRLDVPMIRREKKFEEVTWEEALMHISGALEQANKSKVGFIAGDLIDVETMKVVKDLCHKMGVKNYDCRQDGSHLDNANRSHYIFNTTIPGIENADLCLIVGSNPRHEAPILNARIRKAHINNAMQVALIGQKVDLTYNYKHFGENPWLLKQLADGSHPSCKSFEHFERPMLILGAGLFARDDWEAFMYFGKKLTSRYGFVKDGWNGFNVMQTAASRVGGLDIGFIPEEGGLATNQMLDGGDLDVLFLMGADDINLAKLNPKTKVIYVGHHGDYSANFANIILPSAAYTEKEGTYVNLEGRVQRAQRAVLPVGDAKPDFEIFLMLAHKMGIDLGYMDINGIRKAMEKQNPVFSKVGVITQHPISLEVGKLREFSNDVLHNPIKDFYLTNPISRSSRTMAQCSKTFTKRAA